MNKCKKIIFIVFCLTLKSYTFDYYSPDPKIPEEYFSWQNPALYSAIIKEKTTICITPLVKARPGVEIVAKCFEKSSNDDRPVIVFVHGTMNNSAASWNVLPHLDKDLLENGMLPIVMAYLGQGPCTGATKVQMNAVWNDPVWKPIKYYVLNLCNIYKTEEAFNYVKSLWPPICKLRGIHAKQPAGWFLHDNRHEVLYYVCKDTKGREFLTTKKPILNTLFKLGGSLVIWKGETKTKMKGIININNDIKGADIRGILAWASERYQREDALFRHNGIEFIDIFDPYASLDEYVQDPYDNQKNKSFREGKGLEFPNWNFDTPYGWNGQIILQSIEILEKYWPNGEWKNNPYAKLIFVCKSGAGLALRHVLWFLNGNNKVSDTDVPLKQEFVNKFRNEGGGVYTYFSNMITDPITKKDFIDIRPNIGKVITVASPHVGLNEGVFDFVDNLLRIYDEKPGSKFTPLLAEIYALYTFFSRLADKFQNISCGEEGWGRAESILMDMLASKDYVKRIKDIVPCRDDDGKDFVPFVCFEFEGDEFATNAWLSKAIYGAPNFNEYKKDFLLEYHLYGMTGDNIHERSGFDYVNDMIFDEAFLFQVRPDCKPYPVSIDYNHHSK